MEIASLGLKIDSTDAPKATANLTQMAGAAGLAERMTNSLNKAVAQQGQLQRAVAESTKFHSAAMAANAKSSAMATMQSRNLMFQLNDIGVSLAGGMNPLMVLVQQGSQIATIYEGGVVPALRETARMAGGAALKFGPIAGLAAAAALGIGTLTREINQAGNASVNFGDVAMAAFQVPANAIYQFLKPAITSVSGWWGKEMDIFASQTKTIVNFLTQNFLVGFETIKAGISTMPDAFIVAGQGAANGFLKGIEWLVQQAAEKLNGLMGGLNGLLTTAGMDPIQLFDPASFKIPPLDIGGAAAQGRIDSASAALDATNKGIRGTDFAGEWFGAITDQSAKNATARLAEETDKLSGAAKKAADEAARQAGAYADITRGAEQFIAGQRLEVQALGMTAEAAARLRYEQDLLNRAANDNLNLSSAQTSELGALAGAMAAAEEATRQITEIYDFGKGVFGGFFSDLKSGLTEGKSLWASFANAASNALDTIANKMMENAANGLWDMLFGAVVGGISGGIAGWGNSTGGIVNNMNAGGPVRLGYNLPGYATGTDFAPGGMAWVGERGPEIVNLPRGSQVIPHSQSKAMAANQNQSNDNRPINLTVSVVGAQGNAEVREMARQGAEEALENYRRFQFHRDWETHRSDPRAIG